MKWPLVAVGLLAISPSVMADGKGLHDQSCMQCHATLVGGQANNIYTRSDRKINSFQQLEGRVKSCAMAAGVDWQPREYQQVIRYLATTFYQFD